MFHNPAVLDGCDLLHVQAEHQKTELVLSAGYPVNEPGKADNPFRSWTENRNDSIMTIVEPEKHGAETGARQQVSWSDLFRNRKDMPLFPAESAWNEMEKERNT